MSEANGKVCCNCLHCIRVENGHGNHITCKCNVDGKYLSYLDVLCPFGADDGQEIDLLEVSNG